MSTFVLLTITGLGLGALYFLIASGLSLIYGLMGVLNFAHGAFLTVGAYAMWFTESKLGGVRRAAAVPARRRSPASSSACLRRPGRARPDPAALPPPHRAGAGHGRARARAGRAGRAIWGHDARTVAAPQWTRGHDVGRRRAHPERPLRRDRGGARRTLALNAFLRRTRYGLIIRAGVENRAMVTALGIDVRRAFTLVFAIGGVAAALAGVLVQRLLRGDRPAARAPLC